MSAAKILCTAVALATAALSLPATATASPAASPRGFDNCGVGNFCLYNDWNGGGTVCRWSDDKEENTNDECSFIQKKQNVRSVWNGTGHRKQYYSGTNFNEKTRIGSTGSHDGGNLTGDYQILSFQPQR